MMGAAFEAGFSGRRFGAAQAFEALTSRFFRMNKIRHMLIQLVVEGGLVRGISGGDVRPPAPNLGW
jgi:hypothetical protein